MAAILGIGNVTWDIVNVLEQYPQEDQELRAITQYMQRGGNTANTLVVLQQFGHKVSFLATLANEADGQYIAKDLQQHHIDIQACPWFDNAKSPTSYITLSKTSHSRTIVHYRNLPELSLAHFTAIDITLFDWLHFEARNIDTVQAMLEQAKNLLIDQPISLEIEKERKGIEKLLPYAQVLLFSKSFIQGRGYNNASDFLKKIKNEYSNKILIAAWGEQGAYAIGHENEIYFSKAYSSAPVIETIGAGDTFNAGVIHSLVQGKPLAQALEFACYLAGKKCTQRGFDNLN